MASADRSSTYISTGSLPAPAVVQSLVDTAWERFRDDTDGEVSAVYPALERAAPDRFGICLVGTTGRVYTAGDADQAFAIMSVAKPFTFALVCEAVGVDAARAEIGVNATGRPFNSLAAVEASPDGRTNPMVNAGAIATSAMTPGTSLEERWARLREGLSRFAGRRLELDPEIHASAAATNHRNQAIARLLADRGRLAADPAEAVELYTRQSSLRVTTRDLAVMGATLAGGGVNPVTGERVVAREVCHHVLAVMLTSGLYETTGDWLYDVGLPAKSGIGGGIVTVSPGKGGMGTYGPRLDPAGNSVKGVLAARFLSERLGLDLLASAPTG